jgi:hypothetical protein
MASFKRLVANALAAALTPVGALRNLLELRKRDDPDDPPDSSSPEPRENTGQTKADIPPEVSLQIEPDPISGHSAQPDPEDPPDPPQPATLSPQSSSTPPGFLVFLVFFVFLVSLLFPPCHRLQC